MDKYALPELSFDDALRQLQIAHQLELLRAKPGGCRSPPLPPQLPSSSAMLMATGEEVHAPTIGEGLTKLVEFMEDLPIRHVQQALRQLPRVPPNPSDVIDSECLDGDIFPETPRPCPMSRTTEGTAKANVEEHNAGASCTSFMGKTTIDGSTETSTELSNVLAQQPQLVRHSTEIVDFGGQLASSCASYASYQSVGHSQSMTTPLKPIERWAALMEVVVSKSTVHKAWDAAGRPQDLCQVLDVTFSTCSRTDLARDLIKRRTCKEGTSGTQMLPATLSISAIATDKISQILSELTGANMQYGWAVHPNSKTRIVWDLVGLTVCFYDLITFPMQMVRLINEIAGIAICSTMYWTLDVFMSCISGFFTKEGLVELRVAQVVNQYTRTWMVFDVGLCALDWISSSVEMTDTGAIRLVKSCFRFIRIVRVLRLLKIIPKLKVQLGQIKSEYTFIWFRLAFYICSVVMINHYLACLFCSVWSPLANPSKQYLYVSALHWALSHCLLGSMDLVPDTVEERMFTCSVLVISMVVFATLLSNITQDTANLQALSVEKGKRESAVRKFFDENGIPPELVGRVWHVIRRNDLASGGRVKEDTVEIFNMLPQYLQKELRYASFKPLLVKHPFFEFYNDIEPNALHMLCTSGVKQMRILPYEQLHWPSATGVNLMLFVVKGELDYYPTEVLSLKLPCPAGRWVLEEALWARQAILDGPLTAASEPSELMLVVPHEFHGIAKIHNRTMHLLRVYAREFVRKFNEACLKFEETDLLFNSDAIIIEILEEVKFQCDASETMLPKRRRRFHFLSGFVLDHHVSGRVHDRRRVTIDKQIYEPP